MFLLSPVFNVTADGIKIGSFSITSSSIETVSIKIIKIILILILMYLGIKLGSAIINKSVKKQKNFKFSLDERKAKTIGTILKSTLRYTIYILGFISIFTVIFGTASIAFAGFSGLALGFGAQNVIKDIINGFFILFEDQFTVGDYVDIEGKSGIVETIELRVTKIRDFNGDLHIIPNGLITKVTNHSRGSMRISVAVNIAYNENMDRAIKLINDVCEEFKKDNKDLVEGPSVLGVTDIRDNNYTIKVAGKVKCMTQWNNENELRARIKKALDSAGISSVANSKLQIIKE